VCLLEGRDNRRDAVGKLRFGRGPLAIPGVAFRRAKLWRGRKGFVALAFVVGEVGQQR
jgi:hypothetical protein